MVADWLSRSLEDDVDIDKDIETIAIPQFMAVSEAKEEVDVVSGVWAPYVPNREDFLTAYSTALPEELRLTYEAPDGLRYGVKSRKLFVPILLRDIIMYWFHASRYGGHSGVNKTLRRMQKWIWWPRMASDVQRYVKTCLVCARQGRPQPARKLTSVLTKPLPLQMVSVDHVGPRLWFGCIVTYVVIIDHASRFIVAKRCAATMEATVEALRSSWCHIFAAPNAILTDRGSAFQSSFRKFVVESLMAYHVFTSAYYPQGNSINEASHKALSKALDGAEWLGLSDFDEALENAVAVHNSCPHVAHGVSPFSFLFGFEPTLPGWQKYRDQHDGELRKQRQLEIRQQHLLRSQLMDETNKLCSVVNLEVGDWIVFYLSSFEKTAAHRTSSESSLKYSPSWSLPAKVMKVQQEVVHACEWGSPHVVRQVPKSQVRKLEGAVPASLQGVALRMLELEAPRALRPRVLRSGGPETKPKPWNELLSEAMTKKRLLDSTD